MLLIQRLFFSWRKSIDEVMFQQQHVRTWCSGLSGEGCSRVASSVCTNWRSGALSIQIYSKT